MKKWKIKPPKTWEKLKWEKFINLKNKNENIEH